MVTMPFQNYLILNLFNYISLVLDFRKTETRKFYNQQIIQQNVK